MKELIEALNKNIATNENLIKTFQRNQSEEGRLTAGRTLNAKDSQENFYTQCVVFNNFDAQNVQTFNGQIATGTATIEAGDFVFPFVPRRIQIIVSRANTNVTNSHAELVGMQLSKDGIVWTKEMIIPRLANTVRPTSATANNGYFQYIFDQPCAFQYVRVLVSREPSGSTLGLAFTSLGVIAGRDSLSRFYDGKSSTTNIQSNFVNVIGFQ